MTSNRSRSALIAALAVGACGLVAVPAASAADTQYFVNSPVVTGVSDLTPESAMLSGAVDTGGNPGIEAAEPAGTNLTWAGGVDIINSGASAENIWIDGLPASGSATTVSIGTKPFSNGGADNYSNVEFELDPVADYDANGDLPGSDLIFGDSMQVATQGGLTAVKSTVGAFGVKAQNKSDQAPLKPGTRYYYWIVDQAGTTDDAEDVNTGTAATPSISCVPDAYAAKYDAADPVQGPCIYQFGNASGIDFYQSPNGEFTTPALGKIAIGASAKVDGHKAMLSITDRSGFNASGKIVLKVGGKAVGGGKFSLTAHSHHNVALVLTGAGVSAAGRGAKAKIVLTSDFGQPAGTKSVKL